MPTASPKQAEFRLPFPRGGWDPESGRRSVYRCCPAPGVWARVSIESSRIVHLSFWPHKKVTGGGPLRGPQKAENDLILITALIHHFIATHKGNDHGTSNS